MRLFRRTVKGAADLSQLGAFGPVKCFKISSGHRIVLTTNSPPIRTVCTSISLRTYAALRRDGGWFCSSTLSCSMSGLVSGQGCVWHGRINRSGSTVGIQTAIIWISANFSSTALGVTPGGCNKKRCFRVRQCLSDSRKCDKRLGT